MRIPFFSKRKEEENVLTSIDLRNWITSCFFLSAILIFNMITGTERSVLPARQSVSGFAWSGSWIRWEIESTDTGEHRQCRYLCYRGHMDCCAITCQICAGQLFWLCWYSQNGSKRAIHLGFSDRTLLYYMNIWNNYSSIY